MTVLYERILNSRQQDRVRSISIMVQCYHLTVMSTWPPRGIAMADSSLQISVDIIEFVSKLNWHDGGRHSRVPSSRSRQLPIVLNVIDLSNLSCPFITFNVPLQLVINLWRLFSMQVSQRLELGLHACQGKRALDWALLWTLFLFTLCMSGCKVRCSITYLACTPTFLVQCRQYLAAVIA